MTTYTFYRDSLPDKPLAVLVKDGSNGSIEVLDKDNAPVIVMLAFNKMNNLQGLETILKKRVMPANRMFFREFCEAKGIDADSYDDKLAIADGRTLVDDYYIKVERNR